MKMGIASIIGGPFKASINQRAIKADVVQQDSDIDGSSAEVDFPSDMAIRLSKNEPHTYESCLLLVFEGEDSDGRKLSLRNNAAHSGQFISHIGHG